MWSASLYLGKYFGIPLKVHWTFGLLLLYFTYFGYANGLSFQGILWFMLFVFSLFACVVLHELGHALSARYYGIETRDIILSPIGGLARLASMPHQARQELIIALAGPLVNVVIALVLWVYLYLFVEISWDEIALDGELPSFSVYFWPILTLYNIILVVFNLIPAFPMDGGRVLRALLSYRYSRIKATRIAMWVGRLISLGFVALGLYTGSFTLPIIALFLFYASRLELRSLIGQELYHRYEISALMDPNIFILESDRSEEEARQILHSQGIGRVYLVDPTSSAYLGFIDRETLEKRAEAQAPAATSIGLLVQKSSYCFQSDKVGIALLRIAASPHDFIPVLSEDRRVVGEVQEKNIRQWIKSL
jgi:Zn-dependent protease